MPETIDLTFITGETRRVQIGPAMFIVWDAEGVKFDHLCEVMVDGVQKRTAPRLQIGNGHTIVQDDPLTIRASIRCPACRAHGFVTEGRWA